MRIKRVHVQLREAAGTQQVLRKDQQLGPRLHTLRGSQCSSGTCLHAAPRASSVWASPAGAVLAGQQCQGQSEHVTAGTALPRGEDPSLDQWGWAAEAGLLVGARRGLLSGIQMTFLLGEREREIKALTVCPGTSLRAGPLGRWEWIKSCE